MSSMQGLQLLKQSTRSKTCPHCGQIIAIDRKKTHEDSLMYENLYIVGTNHLHIQQINNHILDIRAINGIPQIFHVSCYDVYSLLYSESINDRRD